MEAAPPIEGAIRSLLANGLLQEDYPLVGVLDEDYLDSTVDNLFAAFGSPNAVQHTVAAKAVTVVPVLAHLATLGLGCEVASPGELAMARLAGFQDDSIIYDSPAKTWRELEVVLQSPVTLNVDNVTELERVDEIVRERRPQGRIGLRINPQRGSGAIDAMSTATTTSKFGFPLRDEGAREQILGTYVARDWLTQIHVHSGSQGITLQRMAEGVRDVLEIAEDLEGLRGAQQITHIDIGGGLPVNFADDDYAPTHGEYVDTLRRVVPELFSGKYTIVTEFGRSLLAKAGFMLSKVEYVKVSGGRRIAVCHAGAQVATRTVLDPLNWPVRATVYSSDGHVRQGHRTQQDLVGPCCFAGDAIAKDRSMPRIEEGDLVAIRDTGAYYFSTHWSYNALPRPAVYGYRTEGGLLRWRCLRKQQSIAELITEAGGDALSNQKNHVDLLGVV